MIFAVSIQKLLLFKMSSYSRATSSRRQNRRCPVTGEAICRCDTRDYMIRPKDTLRKIFTDHVVYTRFVIVDILEDLVNTTADLDRLMQNQEDIGNFLLPYIGSTNAEFVTSLFKEHIRLAGEAVKALKTSDRGKLMRVTDAMIANIDQISDLLRSFNPTKLADVDQMMRIHVQQVLETALAQSQHDSEGVVKIFDAGINHMLRIADTIVNALM